MNQISKSDEMTLGRAIYLIKDICSHIKVSDVMKSHAYATMIIKDLKTIIDDIDVPELIGNANEDKN
jgi:hypothetical protein